MRFCLAIGALAALGVVQISSAATINYGNFGPVAPGISFLNVVESSITDAVPLYGPPAPFAIGIDFDPTNFGSASSGGGSDITEGQLNFTISGKTNQSLVEITNISLFEAGDYTFTGSGTSATNVFAGAILRATVTEVNGVAVAPINLVPINGSVGFNLVANPGVALPWSLGLGLNVQGQVPGATMVEVVINNTLTSASETNSSSAIAKKDFRIDVQNGFVIVIPEPGTLALAGAVLGMLALRRRRCD